MNCDVEPAARLKILNQRASDFTCDHNIPVVRYLRSTKEMERMALVYGEENEYENCFLLYMKLITLLVEKIPKHPQYKSISPEEKKLANKRCKNAISAAEKVKTVLKEKFETDYNNWVLKEEERKKTEEIERLRLEQLHKEEQEKKLLEKKEQEESKKKFEALKVTQPTTTTTTTLPAEQVKGDKTPSFPSVPLVSSDQSLHGSSSLHQAYNDVPNYSNSSSNIPSQPSSRPPPYDIPPPTTHHVPEFDRSNKPSPTSVPGVDRSTKPEEVRNDSSIDGNRRILMSPDLVPRFLQLAHRNTVQNLETCGILTGKLSRNSFRITHLVIPKQSATPDSCTTEHEEELFDVQDKYDLITLGWIHTHPSQTAFLSSVDLHTQCSYQQLMPEAIAIVCSPKYQTVGVFRLTPSYGVRYISSCTKVGFHPHPKEPPLYEESPLATTDGSCTIDIIDLR